MLRLIRWFCVVVALVLATSLAMFAILQTAGSKEPMSCFEHASDLYERCNDLRTYLLARSGYVAALIGIALSFIATIALVITIVLSSRATKAAVEASTLARMSVEHARETSRLELRPYLFVTGYNLQYEVVSEGGVARWYIHIHWKNTGRTPAQAVIARANSLFSPVANLPADFSYPDRSDVQEVVGIVGIDGTFNSPTPWCSLPDIAASIAGKSYLHIWSWAEYDGFEPGVRYRSEYHSRLWFSGDPANPEMKSGCLLEWDFNGLDGNCSRTAKTPPARTTRV